jgi:hypothetical protein
MKKRRLRGGTVALLVVLLAAVTAFLILTWKKPPAVPPARGIIASGKDSVSVFFADEQGRLQRKIVEVQKQLPDKVRGELLFRELKQAKSIPDRLRLHELAFGEGGVLYLNLSKEFTEQTSTEREMTMTYAIVNSFIESFKNVKNIQLLVEGQPVYTKGGLLYLYTPMGFNKDLMED